MCQHCDRRDELATAIVEALKETQNQPSEIVQICLTAVGIVYNSMEVKDMTREVFADLAAEFLVEHCLVDKGKTDTKKPLPNN